MAADQLTVDLGELGSREVDHATENVESNWSDGRSRVDRNGEQFFKMARRAVENFRKADDELTRQLRKSGDNR